ncbi:MAG: hypothetical protein MI866_06455, partial [Bacteroidales bacterium]|nr:hypothetical protein [Bacteroidales bacterium]
MKAERVFRIITIVLLAVGGISQATVTLTTSSNLNLTTGDLVSGTMSNGSDTIGFSINNVQMPKTGDDPAKFDDLNFFKSPANWRWYSVDSNSGVLETYSFELNVTTGEQVAFTFSPSGLSAGNNIYSVFTVTWGVSGAAVIQDPDRQLTVVNNGNGTATFHQNMNFLSNSAQTWSVTTQATNKVFF